MRMISTAIVAQAAKGKMNFVRLCSTRFVLSRYYDDEDHQTPGSQMFLRGMRETKVENVGMEMYGVNPSLDGKLCRVRMLNS